MLRFLRLRIVLALLAAVLLAVMVAPSAAQDDPNEIPLGDVARNLRKKTQPSQAVIDDDNLSQAMEQAENKHAAGSGLKFLMAGESKEFQVSAPDVTCSLSFSANAKSLLSSQYAQMDLPPGDVLKLQGPATIEGDALTVSLFNGTDWHVSEVAIALTVVKRSTLAQASSNFGTAKLLPAVAGSVQQESEVRPEKKPDTTVIYRMRAAAPPLMMAVFSAPLNLDLAPGDEWHWAIVQAKGYPPQSYAGSALQTSPTAASIAPSQPIVPPSLKEPLAEPPAPVQQNPR
jgi:hypothetical protein